MIALSKLSPSVAPVALLMVEDNDDHAMLIGDVLDDAPTPFETERACCLADAKARLEARRYDAILLDLGLPECTGLETLSRMRSFEPEIPIVIMTAEETEEIALEALKIGAEDFLPKFEVGTPSLARTIAFAIERRRANFELTRRNRLLETFAATAGHDLQAPARHIAFLSQDLADRARDKLTAEERETLDDIVDRAAHLRRLLRDTMTFAKLGTRSAHKSVVSLNDIVDKVVAALQPEERPRVSSTGDAWLRLDPSLGFLIFKNLVANGLKYWRETPSRVTVSAERKGAEMHVCVADDGIGIAPDQVERVFNPGLRAVPDDEYRGTGFGLAICRELVVAHEGRIWAESKLGAGTCIRIVLRA